MITVKPAMISRLLFIDGLRGIAAFAVLLHHLYHNTELNGPLRKIFYALPFDLGALGVEVFFVISGFVIALSMSTSVCRVGDLANFMLRRQIRLDIPYWVTILLTISLVMMDQILFSGIKGGFFTPWEIAGNAFYLHRILGMREIVGVAWTLCIEIQFYLVFVGIWILALFAQKRWRLSSPQSLNLIACPTFIIGLVSLYYRSGDKMGSPWFYYYWMLFTLGAFCFWLWKNPASKLLAVLFFTLLFAVLGKSIYTGSTALFVGFLTALTIHIVALKGKLHIWLGSAPLQFLGRISYSLYLTHVAVGCTILHVGYKITGVNPWAAVLWVILATVVSIVAATLFYHFIERPSLRLTARLKRNEHLPDPVLQAASLKAR